jgi:hypothetical protein
LGGCWLLWLWGGAEKGGELRAKEVDFVLQAVDIAADAVEDVAGTAPEDDESNCKNGDQEEFHKQLLGIIGG